MYIIITTGTHLPLSLSTKLVVPEKLLFHTDHFGLFCESYTTRKGFVCNAPRGDYSSYVYTAYALSR